MILIGLLAIAGQPSRARAQAEDDVPTELKTVASVKFEGKHHVPDKAIWPVVKTKRPSIWPWHDRPRLRVDFLRADTSSIAAVFRQRGYLDATVSWRILSGKDPSLADVRFVIVEGKRSKIRKIEWQGVAAVSPDQLKHHIYAKVGQPFNPAYLVADTLRIERFYQDRGYLPRVRASASRESVDVTVGYNVFEGPAYTFGRVYLSSPGELHTREYLVRRELLIKDGEPFRMNRVERSIDRIYGTGLFSQAQITLLPDSARRKMEFDLRVRDKKTRWIDAGVGSGTSERFRFTGEWGHRNLTGHGQQLTLNSRLAFDGNGKFLLTRTELALLEPWLFKTRTRGQLTGYFEDRNDRADPRWVVEQTARGFSVQLRREPSPTVLLRATFDNTYVTQALTILQTGIPQATIDSLQLETKPYYTTHRLQLGFDHNTRDNPLNPSRGSIQSVLAEIAGGPLKGTSSFRKLQGAVGGYQPRNSGTVFAWRFRAGGMQPFGEGPQLTPVVGLDTVVAQVPLEDRFRIGGVNTIRGYNENSIPSTGGLAVIQANVEFRIPVVGPFGIEVYADVGNVWERPERIRIGQFRPEISHETLGKDDVRYVFGIGPRLNLPIGPLRLDFTWSLRPSGSDPALVAVPQFAIGPSF
jgi:outer membrane protein insertion porin family